MASGTPCTGEIVTAPPAAMTLASELAEVSVGKTTPLGSTVPPLARLMP